jgi:hypothetical protein
MVQVQEKRSSRACEIIRLVESIFSRNEPFYKSLRREAAREATPPGHMMNYSDMVKSITDMLARNSRDLDRPGYILYEYCSETRCSSNTLEKILQQVGFGLVTRHRVPHGAAQHIINMLLNRVVALGRIKHGR